VLQNLSVHPHAAICYRELHILARPNTCVTTAIGVIQLGIRRLHDKLSAGRHGIARVDCEIDQSRFQLCCIDFNRPYATLTSHFQ
jgi:hypothetical protein